MQAKGVPVTASITLTDYITVDKKKYAGELRLKIGQ